MKIQNIDESIAKIKHLYTVYGEHRYEEKCTQLQHAEQCGTLALERGFGEEVALAAFLHDIGHFIADEENRPEHSAYGYPEHDQLGANYLIQLGFSNKISELVGQHVQVKRYLALTRKNYLENLSHASTFTLKQQGGPMSTAEADNYATTPHLKEIIQLRDIDDSGKLPEKTCQPLNFWLKLAKEELSNTNYSR